MDLFESLGHAILKHESRPAFCINGLYYSYRDLAEKISAIRLSLSQYAVLPTKGVGLVVDDDLETYAAAIAIWLEGRFYVPINLQGPPERNAQMIRQAEIEIIADSSNTVNFSDYITIETKKIPPGEINLLAATIPGDELAYTLFTSGSTGSPKAVPITRNNLSAFVDSFFQIGMKTDEHDKWLQMFDLTFDLSIFSYLVPLLQGACVYTIPKNQIKYNYISKLLDEYHLTVALMIPSVIQFLQPYFNEIDNRTLKYSLFCGESLPVDLAEKWSACIPVADVFNLYGPTEATIFCTCYAFERGAPNKARNGILSVGKPMHLVHAIIVDYKNDPVKDGDTGELCLSGCQITPGYSNDPVLNASSFFEHNLAGGSHRFYKTGDLCSIDRAGDILFSGRLDSQVKINGFRVELSEIEFHARMFLTGMNLAALSYMNEWKTAEIGLAIETPPFDTRLLNDYLRKKLPSYMIPATIRFESAFPLNKNGKTDKTALLKRFL